MRSGEDGADEVDVEEEVAVFEPEESEAGITLELEARRMEHAAREVR